MVDKARNLSKDFRCRKDDMLRHMQYFHPYLSAVSAEGKVVDIAVFCDVRVFEWLVDYISSSSLASRPKPGEVATAQAAWVVQRCSTLCWWKDPRGRALCRSCLAHHQSRVCW